MEIPQVKIQYQLKITEKVYDGFKGILPTEKKFFKSINQVRDNKITIPFEKGDLIKVILESKEKVQEDFIGEDLIQFYIVVYQIATNGLYTKSYVEGVDPKQSTFFYESRGMITSPVLENNRFEQGDIIRVTLKR